MEGKEIGSSAALRSTRRLATTEDIIGFVEKWSGEEQVVDLREKEEFEASHLRYAVSVPLASLLDRSE